jgi:prepilin-type N-terminal cleavage/methylation domain-containing protein/prepilin-type processing-associated H-X9-DG protein
MRMQRSRDGFTLVELLVVIAVITILASLTLPAIDSSMQQATSVQCRSNLGQIGKGCFMYSNQYARYLPCYGEYANPVDPETGERSKRDATMMSTHELVFPYIKDPEIFVCPSDATPDNCVWWLLEHPNLNKSSYMWSEHVMTWERGAVPLQNYRNPHEVGLVADGWECPNGWTWLTCLPPRLFANSRIDWEHDGGVNFVFADQHVEKVQHAKLDQIRSDPR